MWAIRTSRYRPGLKWLTEGLKVPGDGEGGRGRWVSGRQQKANRVWNFDLLLIVDHISLSAHIFWGKKCITEIFRGRKKGSSHGSHVVFRKQFPYFFCPFS
ncbi:hypothetical protein CEXT_476471 [Caerostris extrusa]|uniref:Uncharacterized protein n=1 Tax=Caerostris extrusa TaxID=172846 RepID=A0AAV4VXI6_CAEEX|nr:hypothetical protein CEXT_476471 [Caerostris extrusa]